MPDYSQSVAENFVTITPSDTTTLSIRGFHVGEAGDVVVTSAAGNDFTFKNCAAGSYYPYAVRKIKEATSAGSIVGLV